MSAPGTLHRSWQHFVDAGGLWLERNAFVHAGSLAFYTLFSMAPVVIITVAVAGMLFGVEAARGKIVAQLDDLVGRDAARTVEDVVSRSRPEVSGIIPTLMGLITLIVGSTTVFAQLQISLNSIWGARLLSLAIVLTIGFVLLVSLLLSVALSAVIAYAEYWLPLRGVVFTGAEFLLSLVVITLLFAVIFKVLPDVQIAWRDVWAGAAVTAVLFIVGRYLIAIYLAYAAPASAYGAAGSLVLVLLWVYYSSLIVLFGAAFTKVRTVASSGRVVPGKMAVLVRTELVEQDGPASDSPLA